MATEMSSDELKFLWALDPSGAPTSGWNLPSANRASDKARTSLKRQGLIEFDRTNWAWKLTDKGVRLMGVL